MTKTTTESNLLRQGVITNDLLSDSLDTQRGISAGQQAIYECIEAMLTEMIKCRERLGWIALWTFLVALPMIITLICMTIMLALILFGGLAVAAS